jgi:GNAT superfamily N-acetyltransferase
MSVDSSAVEYVIEQFIYETATPEDSADIGAVYDHCFSHDLNLVFDPSLDSDFVNPCQYYSEASGGAFFVVRRKVIKEDTADDDGAERERRCPIVGTLGVRNFTFESEERWAAFVAGIKANSNSCESEIRLVSSSSCVVGKVPPASSSLAGGSSGCPQVTIQYSGAVEGASVPPRDLKICELKRMFFLPECRGRQLGKQQVLVALDWATKAGYDLCILDTKRRLEAANHVYEKYGGFVEGGSYNGNPRADKFMCKCCTTTKK